MMIHEYAEALDNAVKFKESGKSFEQYEKEAQSKMSPIECQMMWIMAEYVMDKTAEVVNKETAELVKQLGKKESELNKLKKRLNKMSGALDISDNEDYEFNAIGKVSVTIGSGINGAVTSDDVIAKTYDRKSKTVSGKGLTTKIEKSQTLGNWFVVHDLDTGSKKVYRLNNVDGYAELRYPMVTEPAPIPEDIPKKFDPDKRVHPKEPKEYDGPMNEEEAERHKQYWNEKAAKKYLERRCNGEHDDGDPSNYGDNGGGF